MFWMNHYQTWLAVPHHHGRMDTHKIFVCGLLCMTSTKIVMEGPRLAIEIAKIALKSLTKWLPRVFTGPPAPLKDGLLYLGQTST